MTSLVKVSYKPNLYGAFFKNNIEQRVLAVQFYLDGNKPMIVITEGIRVASAPICEWASRNKNEYRDFLKVLYNIFY